MSFTQQEVNLASEAWVLGLLSDEEFAVLESARTRTLARPVTFD